MPPQKIQVLLAGEAGLFLESLLVVLRQSGMSWSVDKILIPLSKNSDLTEINTCQLLVILNPHLVSHSTCRIAQSIKKNSLACPVLFLHSEGEATPSFIPENNHYKILSKTLSFSEFYQEIRTIISKTGRFIATPPPKRIHLTKRQKEILHALAKGRSNKEIALDLDISHNTVRVHVSGIFQKLKVRSRRDIVRRFQEEDFKARIE
ncbi:response regulator transcription factor [Magnetococcales bacterium HHB-1]